LNGAKIRQTERWDGVRSGGKGGSWGWTTKQGAVGRLATLEEGGGGNDLGELR
jgi:hypothetical protein